MLQPESPESSHHHVPHQGASAESMRTHRNEEIPALFFSGMTLQEIGAKFGLTRQRVQQILRDQGITRHHGGGTLRAEARREGKEIQRQAKEKQRIKNRLAYMEQWSLRELGVPLTEAFTLNGAVFSTKRRSRHDKSVYQKYLGIKYQFQLKHQGETYLTLREWREAWVASGHWENGPGKGWALVKKEVSQAWTVENVHVVRMGAWMKRDVTP